MKTTVENSTPSRAGTPPSRPPFPANASLLPPRCRPRDYFVVDFETTGLDPARCEVIEVACVHVHGNHVSGKYASLVRIECRLSAAVSRLTGITDEMLEEAPSFEEAMRGLGDFIGSRRYPIFAHNAAFDAKVIWAHGIADYVRADCPIGCSLELARRAFPHLRSHALDSLVRELGLIRFDAHRALGDCLATAQVIDVCYAEEERERGMHDAVQGQMSLALELPACPKCGSSLVAKDGFTQAGTQMYRCKDCGKKYSERTRIDAKGRARKSLSFSEARALSPDGQLACSCCGSTRLKRKSRRGESACYRCSDCGKHTTFWDDGAGG